MKKKILCAVARVKIFIVTRISLNKSFNFFGPMITLLWPHYFQWFTSYLNQVDLRMPHIHVLKKLPYCLMWILSCVEPTNACSKLTIKNQINLLNVFKVKNKYSIT